jgi:hypothetical protein
MPFWPAVLYAVGLHLSALQQTMRARASSGAHRSPGHSVTAAVGVGVGVAVGASASAAFVLATLVVACLQQLYFIGVMQSADGADALREVTRFAEANAGRSIAMGYANAGERSTFVRPVLVFRSGRYPIDAPAVQEFEMSGLELPRATIDALRRCDVEMWLIPKGATPFDGPNKYPAMANAPLFPHAFKQAFLDAYAVTRDADDPGDAGHMRAFDVWRCRRGSLP